MKNITCPVSGDRIPEAQPRVSAFVVVVLLGLSMIYDLWFISFVLFFDFFQRGVMGSRYSPVGQMSHYVALRWFSDSRVIDKAPKIFAARLGFLFTGVIVFAHTFGATEFAFVLSALLIVFASLECFLKVCIGCYVYSFIHRFFLEKI